MRRIRSRRLALSGVAVVAVAVLASACTAEQPRTVPVTTGERPSSDVVALPQDRDAAIAAATDRLPGFIEDGMTRTGVPGLAVAVVSAGKVVYESGFGVRDTRTGEPVDTGTVFQIASLSKPLAATTVAKIVSDGGAAWSTPVQKLLPGFTMKDPYVTQNGQIADYFSHRTGIPTGAGDDLEDLGFDQATILSRLNQIPLAPFRITYQYSTFGLTVGAEAAAASRGQTWSQAADELLFQPLGMTSTSASHAAYLAAADRAVLHAKTGDKTFEPLFDRNPDAEAPAGGVSSTVGDIAKWMEFMLSGGQLNGQQYIDAKALSAMTSAQMISPSPPSMVDRPGHYGFGINVTAMAGGRVNLNHSGAFGWGGATAATMIPDLDLGIVVLTNGAPVGLPEAITQEFLDVVAYGYPVHDWVELMGQRFASFADPSGDLADKTAPSGAAAPGPLSAYTGTYTSPYFGTLVVTEQGGALQGALGPSGGYTFAVEPWDGDTWAFAPTGENALPGSLSSATFVRAGASASQVTLQYFDKFGLGAFTRTG